MGALSGTVEQQAPEDHTRTEHQHWYTRFRRWVGRRRTVDLTYRVVVGVVGTAVLITGLITIPYPGPGWLIVFAGLAILGTEFQWAQRLLRAARRRYDAWTRWLRRQRLSVRLTVMSATAFVVLLTLWLVNAFGLVAEWTSVQWDWVGAQWEWLRSPLL